jgi:hypothetical protein
VAALCFCPHHYLIKPFKFTVNHLSYAPERRELEDRGRDVMQDLQTKFVPPLASYYMITQKRSATNADEVHTLETYEVSSAKCGI